MKTLEMNSDIYFSDSPIKFSLMQYVFKEDIWQTSLGPGRYESDQVYKTENARQQFIYFLIIVQPPIRPRP